MKLSLIIRAMLCVAALGFNGVAASDEKAETQGIGKYDVKKAYQATTDLMGDVDKVLAKAAAEDKLALLVVGANWCHDSRAFVSHLNDKDVDAIATSNYETLFVDVGFLEYGFDAVKRFGRPVIYGTPTVLIVDPKTNRLLNNDSLADWYDSASFSPEEAGAYLKAMSSAAHRNASKKEQSTQLKTLLSDIVAFEVEQSKRIYQAFKVIGPKLADKKMRKSEEFGAEWGALRKMRYAIPRDMKKLREEARTRVAAGETKITLTYPTYPKLPWE